MTVIVSPVIIPNSNGNGNNIEIALCKTLPTLEQQHQCLIELQKQVYHDDAVFLGCLVGLILVAVALIIWFNR